MIENTLPELHYAYRNGLFKLPEWAEWFIQKGTQIGGLSQSDRRLVFGISAPIRQFAGLLTALGIILERINKPVEDHDNQEYFDFLRGLPRSTAISFLTEVKKKDGEKALKVRDGMLDGLLSYNGSVLLKVLYIDSKKNDTRCTRCFTIKNCHEILISDEKDVDISSVGKKGSLVVKNLPFLSQFMQGERLVDFCIKSRLECLFIGQRNRTISELNFNFMVTDNNKHFKGNFLDLIRPKRIHSFRHSFRSSIYPANIKKPPGQDDRDPWCVIFDSANGYLKWHHHFNKSHQVIILDRTEHLYRNAAQNINKRYNNRINDELFIDSFQYAPPGIEIASFLEGCNV